MVLAMEAWDIQRFSKGRFALGLGSQVKGHNTTITATAMRALRFKESSLWL